MRGKYWDDVKAGWLDPVLIRKASGVSEKVTMSQGWKETGKNPVKTGWADTNKISMGQGIQHWTQARLVQRNITSGRVKLVISESASSKQKRSVLLVIDVRRASTSSFRKETEEDQAVGSVGC